MGIRPVTSPKKQIASTLRHWTISSDLLPRLGWASASHARSAAENNKTLYNQIMATNLLRVFTSGKNNGVGERTTFSLA